MRTTAVSVAVVLVMAQTAVAGQIMESAERLAREAGAAQITSSRRVRSKARLSTGLALGAAGAVMVVYELSQCAAMGPDADHYDPRLTASYDSDLGECVLDTYPNNRAPRVYPEADTDPRILWSGAGMLAFGLLLSTVWSDVDANESITFGTRPGAVEITKRIGW